MCERLRALNALTLSMIIIVSLANFSKAQPSTTHLREKLLKAFLLTQEASKCGGNVTGLVLKLNKALEIIRAHERGLEVNVSEAERLIDEVLEEAPLVKEEGIRQSQFRFYVKVATVAGLIFLLVFVYVYLPRLFWRYWLKFKRNWVVRRP